MLSVLSTLFPLIFGTGYSVGILALYILFYKRSLIPSSNTNSTGLYPNISSIIGFAFKNKRVSTAVLLLYATAI